MARGASAQLQLLSTPFLFLALATQDANRQARYYSCTELQRGIKVPFPHGPFLPLHRPISLFCARWRAKLDPRLDRRAGGLCWSSPVDRLDYRPRSRLGVLGCPEA
ncbi:hypothetical protein GQ53DRAFT_744332 [Thozetella sp. PMI_491]|nr:hypothetical protein GQ53DRAFT_744332 [Thozetella sp. PMI_491]